MPPTGHLVNFEYKEQVLHVLSQRVSAYLAVSMRILIRSAGELEKKNVLTPIAQRGRPPEFIRKVQTNFSNQKFSATSTVLIREDCTYRCIYRNACVCDCLRIIAAWYRKIAAG